MQQKNNTKVPDNQVVYGSIDYQNEFVNDNLINKNPKFYLTKIINTIFSNAFNGGFNFKPIIINGLDIYLNNISVHNNHLVTIIINPGTLVIDDTIVTLNDSITLNIDLTIDIDTNILLTPYIVITLCYSFGKNNLLKFNIHALENLESIDSILPQNCFIYRYLFAEYKEGNIYIRPYTDLNNQLNIDFIQDIIDRYKKNLLLTLIEENLDIFYFIDLPYIPSVPNSTVFGITKMFTH